MSGPFLFLCPHSTTLEAKRSLSFALLKPIPQAPGPSATEGVPCPSQNHSSKPLGGCEHAQVVEAPQKNIHHFFSFAYLASGSNRGKSNPTNKTQSTRVTDNTNKCSNVEHYLGTQPHPPQLNRNSTYLNRINALGIKVLIPRMYPPTPTMTIWLGRGCIPRSEGV